MEPAAIIEEHPECLTAERAEVGDHGREHFLLPLIMQGAGEMVMIDDERSFLRPEDDRDHVPAKVPATGVALLTPPISLSFDLAKTNRQLGWTKVVDRDRNKHGFSAVSHDCTC
jgi:hypothetical protein